MDPQDYVSSDVLSWGAGVITMVLWLGITAGWLARMLEGRGRG